MLVILNQIFAIYFRLLYISWTELMTLNFSEIVQKCLFARGQDKKSTGTPLVLGNMSVVSANIPYSPARRSTSITHPGLHLRILFTQTRCRKSLKGRHKKAVMQQHTRFPVANAPILLAMSFWKMGRTGLDRGKIAQKVEKDRINLLCFQILNLQSLPEVCAKIELKRVYHYICYWAIEQSYEVFLSKELGENYGCQLMASIKFICSCYCFRWWKSPKFFFNWMLNVGTKNKLQIRDKV